ncbi:MAG: ABC transporter substrate-binding protein [Chloroflexota bacterium]|nr:ABC transporter substrate-binding protein [Chloroflexota bacterium]
MEPANYWQRLARRRMSRRRLLQAGAAAALGGVALAVVGCEGGKEGGGPAPSPTLAAGEPKYGGVLRFGYGTDPVGLDPHQDIAALSVMAKMYSYLYHVGAGSQAVMNLADSMEHPDDNTYLFRLKQNARFQPKPPVDGREITAEDVRYSFQRRSSALVSIDLRFPQIIDKLEAVDNYTFRLTTKRPFAPTFYEMANNTWAIVPKEAVEQFGDLKQNPISGGPYMLKRFVRAERVEMEKNPNFYFPGRPYLDGLEYIVIPDDSALLAAFQSKQHDINGATLNALRVRELRKNEEITIIERPDLYYPVLWVKTGKAPFNDIRVRQAIDLAIDRQEIIDKIFFGEAKINGPIAWGHDFWALSQEELQAAYTYDPEGARRLLAEANYPDGFTVTLKTANNPGNWRDIVTLVAEQLGRVGIKVDLQLMDLGAWLGSVLLVGAFDMTFFIQLPYEEPDRPLAFYHSLGISGNGNLTDYGNKELDALIDAQQRSFDDNERQKLILEAQRLILREHGPQFTLASGYNYTAHWNYVQGWWPDAPETHANDYNWEFWLDKA